jgi:Zn-dependent protease/CBS domain-containing protein
VFGRKIRLFRLFGFEIGIDPSWFVLLLLIVWSLAFAYFPQAYPDLGRRTYLGMGLVGALGLFVSVILHELMHSLVARRHGMEMKGITLFMFGGVAEMPDQPERPGAEFKMAVAGPLASLAIAAVCWGISRAGALPEIAEAIFGYLAMINLVLVIFNLLPAFPLDGGRMLRAAIWHYTHNVRRATRISSGIGVGFGYLLVFLGVLAFISGNVIGGLWYFLIGMFLSNAARMSYRQLVVRQALEGEPVRRFMKPDPVGVPPGITVREFVEDYVYRYHHKLYPVLDDGGRLAGCITVGGVKGVPREEWGRRTVRELMSACSLDNTVRPGEDVVKAMEKMSRGKLSRLLVVEESRLAGILTLKDLLEFLSVKMELEEQAR